MATEDGEDIQRAEKVALKRKLTGPPRLLLGKTRTRSVGEDRSEARTDRNKTENSTKYPAAAESEPAELTETANVDEGVSSGVTVESSRGRRGAAGKDDEVNKRVKKRRWWRRFSPAVVCNRRLKMDVEERLEKQKNDGSVPPEGALQEENTTGTKGKRRFKLRMWPTVRRFLTSSNVQRTHEQKTEFGGKDEVSTTLQTKMCNFFTKERKSRSSGTPTRCEEAPGSRVPQVDELTESHREETVGSLEVVMVTAELSPDETPTQEQHIPEEDLTDSVKGPETIHVEVVPDAAEPLSVSTASSLEVCKGHCEEKTTSHCLQPSINGPSIRIELVPPDEEDGEDECWEDGSSSENHDHHLLLLGFEHSEQRLVHAARSLVRAAMNAAVDQLTRERQSNSDCVQREPPGCRDHA